MKSLQCHMTDESTGCRRERRSSRLLLGDAVLLEGTLKIKTYTRIKILYRRVNQQHQWRLGSLCMSTESEQGVLHGRAGLPCLTEHWFSTGMEPKFQTTILKQVTNSAQVRQIKYIRSDETFLYKIGHFTYHTINMPWAFIFKCLKSNYFCKCGPKLVSTTHHERFLLVDGLEASVSKLGSGIDELQVDLLLGTAVRLDQQRLSEGQHPLLGSNHTTLQHQEVIFHFTIVDKATL